MHRTNTADSGFQASESSCSGDNTPTDTPTDFTAMKDFLKLNGVNNNDLGETITGMTEFDMVNGVGEGGPHANGLLHKKPLLDGEATSMTSDNSDQSQHVAMKKQVGLLSGVALIVGTMIGSGIFISPKGVLMSTGSVGLSLIVWALCGILALFGALCYAELGTMITKSGAEYAYIQEAFSPLHRAIGPIPAFLYAWTSVLILKPALFGVVAMSFALYTVEPFFGYCGPPEAITKLVAIICLLIVTFINAYSVSLATKVQNFFTVTKLVAVAIIIIGGIYNISNGSVEYLKEGFEDTTHSASMIALAFYDGLWAYDGWNNLNYVTEEIRNPFKNLPRSIMIGIPLVTVCYILMNISYLTVMSRQELLMSAAVATTWGDRVLGVAAILIPISVAFSTFGAANGSCFTGGRVMYVAAREGHLPEIFSYVHVGQYTPLPSLLVSTVIASIMVLMGEIFQLIDFFSFAAWFFYGLTMLSLIVLRITQKERSRPYRVPLIIPIIVLLVSIYLVIAPIIQDPRIEFLYATMFIVGGLFFYIPFVLYRKRLPYMDKITFFMQMVLWVAPSKYVPAE